MQHVVIIGNGIAGVTAARNIRKRHPDFKITLISSESKHFYSRTALMYIFMGHMKYEHTKPYEDWFWEKNRIELKMAHVDSIDFDSSSLVFSNGDQMGYDKLVIATGSKSNKFGWPGQDLKGVQGLYNLQDLEILEDNAKNIDHAVIVGGGLIGVELSEMLHSRGIKTTFIIREKGFWQNVLPSQESKLIDRHLNKHGVELILESSLQEIGSKDGISVSHVVLEDGKKIDCQLVGLTVGVSPNIDFLKGSSLEINKGILVNSHLKTNLDHVFAVGDCVEVRNPVQGRRPIEPVWYTGRMMGEVVAQNIVEPTVNYEPGYWFNSAKFYDIEYQVYGYVPNQNEEKLDQFYWEHEKGDKAIRIVFDKNSKVLLGMNAFGIRFRHETFNSWLESQTHISEVLTNLEDSFFDPEFFENYYDQIKNSFNHQFPDLRVDGTTKKKSIFASLFN